LELFAGYGDGPGNKQDFKTYALFGRSFWGGRLKLFQHASFETWLGDVYRLPQTIAYGPAPQTAADVYWGALISIDPSRSWHITLDGKYSLGPFSLYYMVPFGVDGYNLVFAQCLVKNDYFNNYDRYGVLEYKDRYARDRIGLTIKAYGIQFVRDYDL